MNHTYPITGMTCSSCEEKVKNLLLAVNGITDVEVSHQTGTAVISMRNHIPVAQLQDALGGDSARYKITAAGHPEPVEATRTWFETYRPILLIFTFITTVTLLAQAGSGAFDGMLWMRHFMAGFFLVFSFFKLLNLRGFAESYAMYDVVAWKWPAWGYVYAFIELALGIAYLVNFEPLITNTATLVVMAVSIIGVFQTVLNRKRIQCACLGAVFNLPMSTVTIIEDGLMIAMSAAMLVLLI
jgi:copper chaperone CopZ